MNIYHFPGDAIPPRPRAVALGYFDGAHIGHRAVIGRAVSEGLTSCVFTFDRMPKKTAGRLTSEQQKRVLIAAIGADEMIVADFGFISPFPPGSFVLDVLKNALSAQAVFCGEDFRFGRNAAGNAKLLRELCEAAGIKAVTVPAVTADGEPVSSSRIRRLLEQGEIITANRLLGRPFTIDGAVVHGKRLGRTLGIPTINQPLPPDCPLPYGVYASAVLTDGKLYHGITNIGVRPTVEDAVLPVAETWLLGFEGDLYGQTVPVIPLHYIRPEIKFGSREELSARVRQDALQARELLNGNGQAVFFDFDDTLQDRAAAFGGFCDWFLNRYFLELSPEERQSRKQQMIRLNNRGYVSYPDFWAELTRLWDWADAPAVPELIREYQLKFPTFTRTAPDAAAVLSELRRRGYKIGVITNGASVQQNRKLDISGLRPLCDVCIVSDDWGLRKPDPAIFNLALLLTGSGRQGSAFVGDHPANDMEGAAAAGLRPILCAAYVEASGQWETVGGLTELLDKL